jgi:hypothetical protein
MKKSIFMLAIAVVFTAFFTSCEKDAGELPNISFKSGGNYLNHNDTVNVNDTVLIGINASKSEDKDVLKSFDASRSYDNGAGNSFISESLSGSSGDSYSKDVTVITRNQAGTETYTFTVVNRDGLKNSVSLTLTVIP